MLREKVEPSVPANNETWIIMWTIRANDSSFGTRPLIYELIRWTWAALKRYRTKLENGKSTGGATTKIKK